MSSLARGRALQGIVTLILLAPLALFVVLRTHPRLDRGSEVPVQHFYLVSVISLAALTMAILVGIVSVRSHAPRTFFIAAGFLAVAGIFSIHGLMTPGKHLLITKSHNAVAISARLSLFVGGICFVLSTVSLPIRAERFIARHHRRLVAVAILLVAGFISANLLRPSLLDSFPTGQNTGVAAPSKTQLSPADTSMTEMPDRPESEIGNPAPEENNSNRFVNGQALNYGMAIVSGLLLLLAAWRYLQIYTLSLLPATGALAVGMLLLAESQVSMTLGTRWHLSWWLYHVLMLAGFLIPIAGIGWAYRRGRSLEEIVAGLSLRDTLAKIQRSFPEAMEELIAATVAKDPYLRGHSRRVCSLTVEIGEQLGLSYDALRAASHGALLHDIGKIGIPAAVLQKPGRLTDDEFAIMQTHPMRGYHILSRTPVLRDAAPVIRWHHERLDGSGYPDRLAGDQMPLGPRIVAVADVWDALTSDRVYRGAWNPDAARRILLDEAGSKLDVRCVDALFAVLDRQAVAPSPVRQQRDEHRIALLAG